MDLNDANVLKSLQSNGLLMTSSESSNFSVKENISTGYSWHVKPTCKGVMSIKESYDSPIFGEDDIPAAKGAPGTKYFTLIG